MEDLPILILVDDDVEILNALERALHNIPAEIKCFNSGMEALQYCKLNKPDVIISDQHMPEIDGCELLTRIYKIWPHSQRIILSAYQDFQRISSAFNSGIVERFICKPWENKELRFIIEKALQASQGDAKPEEIKNTNMLPTPVDFHGIIASDETMLELFNSIKHAACTNAPIFVTGETGTGKELVAHACHQEGFHQSQPFIAVNCANFSESLIESQLFGHIKGSFTGATCNQEGLFSAAKQGTLFLDEINSLSLPLQAKLLRVVQEREYSPLGTHKLNKFHAQIISASSTSLGGAVLDGTFREDLYYRLNVVTIDLPPLRERGTDLLLLAKFFLKKYSKIENKQFIKLSRDAIQIMCSYDWPGNIRQLENVIHGMVILNTGNQITAEMIIKSLSSTVSGYIQKDHINIQRESNKSEESFKQPSIIPPKHSNNILPLWQIEKQAIESAIEYCNGNIPKAAALLEVSPSTLYRKKQVW